MITPQGGEIQKTFDRAEKLPEERKVRMNGFMKAALESFKVTEDFRKSLIELLYLEALDGNLFAKEHVLLGMGAFEESFSSEEEALAHYRDFVDEFELATGKRILGDWGGTVPEEEIAPNPNLSEEEYLDALMAVVLDAQAGTEIEDSWIPHNPGSDGYEAKLKYCEVLAYNAGANAWDEWLEDMVDLEDDELETFMEEATQYYHEQFFEGIKDLREMDTAE